MASSLDGHQAPVLELETGPGGMLLSGDRSGHVILWDLMSGGPRAFKDPVRSYHVSYAFVCVFLRFVFLCLMRSWFVLPASSFF